MKSNNRYKGAKAKREAGGYVTFSSVVLRSESYALLSAYAVKLLNDLLAQYKGDNNGDLCAAWTLMEKRNWKSRDTLHKALKELLTREWLILTRQGGRRMPSLYAVTFFSIDDCKGKLDIPSTHGPMSLWRKHEPVKPLVPEGKKLNGFIGDTPGVLKASVMTRPPCQ